MSKPSFFCGIDTLNKLITMEFEEDGHKDLSFSIDVIEIPYALHFSGDDEKQHLKVMMRGELCLGSGRFAVRPSVVVDYEKFIEID